MKSKGNDAMKKCEYKEAVEFYSDAIKLDPENHVLYSNRSAAYLKQDCYEDALRDAESTIQFKSKWPKVNSPTEHYKYAACISDNWYLYWGEGGLWDHSCM